MPPGRMKERSGARSSLSRSISPSIQVDLRVGDGEPRAAGTFLRQAEIGLDVEQIVLDAAKRRIERGIARGVQTNQPDRGVHLVERAVGRDAQIVFLAAVAGAERRRAVVAGAGVDAVQYDHGVLVDVFVDVLLGVLLRGMSLPNSGVRHDSIISENCTRSESHAFHRHRDHRCICLPAQ